MKISNTSRWRTDDLVALVATACFTRGVCRDELVVEVVTTTDDRSGGCVDRIGGRYVRLRLASDPDAWPVRGSTYRRWARAMIDHEVAHLAGLRHEQMSATLREGRQPTPHLDRLPLRLETTGDVPFPCPLVGAAVTPTVLTNS